MENRYSFGHLSSTFGGLISPRLMKTHEDTCIYMWVDARLGGKADCNTCLLDRFVCSAGQCRGGKYKRIETHLLVVDTRLVARPIATHMLTRMCHGSNAIKWWSNNSPIKEHTWQMLMSVVHLLLIKTFGTAMYEYTLN